MKVVFADDVSHGTLIAEVTSQGTVKGHADRWFQVKVYCLADFPQFWQTIVVYGTDRKNEATMADSRITASDGKDVERFLRSRDPLRPVVGFPPGEQFAKKQAALERQITRQWEWCIEEILKQLPEAS